MAQKMFISRCARQFSTPSGRCVPRRHLVAPTCSYASISSKLAVRHFSSSIIARKSKIFDYEALKPYTEKLPENTVLIDVREPDEYAEGHIPNAINIPVKSKPDALLLSEEEFEDHFGFAKPSTGSETIFYCRAGVRSKAASQIAESAGYGKVVDYSGSWLDWTAKGGKVSR